MTKCPDSSSAISSWLASRRAEKAAVLAAIFILFNLLSSCRSQQSVARPSIEFTQIPPTSEGGPDKIGLVAGRVRGAHAGERIVIFAKSGIWWVQPRVDQPFTEIRPDSTWSSSTHLGTEYAALLVDSGYRPPATVAALPNQSADVIAVATVKGTGEANVSANKKVEFSGYQWEVRHLPSNRGGAVDFYDPSNAWVDESGFLHLRIAGAGHDWKCAEVRLTRSLGYGSYIFTVRDTSHLEPAAVFSMLTWDDLGANENHREMDIEISRWGDPTSKNAQFVVQPYYVPANVVRFMAHSGTLTYSWRWEPARVAFKTARGTHAMAEHIFTSGVPPAGGESVHMNLYVFHNARSPLQSGTEVVIEKFEYLP